MKTGRPLLDDRGQVLLVLRELTLIGHSQLMSTLFTPSGKNGTTTSVGHSLEKSVLTKSGYPLRLIRSLWHRYIHAPRRMGTRPVCTQKTTVAEASPPNGQGWIIGRFDLQVKHH
jgi:hypothetical protein